jgi:hypothetical protein
MRCQFPWTPAYLLRYSVHASYVRYTHKDNGGGAFCAFTSYEADQARALQYADRWPHFHTLTANLGAEKFAKKLLRESDIEAVLQRLDRLTADEARVTVTQTLQVVHGLVTNMGVVMNGMQPLLVRCQIVDYTRLSRRKDINE